mmetsp:Transcript_24207/g.38030  ORF Transcript_24207/g.38030 Transcript_24207/m.38030 type:complete len:378 (-) Transcript_24207:30-1163(-)
MVELGKQLKSKSPLGDLRRPAALAGRHSLESLGVFSYNNSVFQSDRYGDGLAAEARLQGKQFMTSPAKHGMGIDATFSKFRSIHNGDAYTSPEDRRRAYEREKRSKIISPKPFKPSSVLKLASHLHSHSPRKSSQSKSFSRSPTKQQSGYGTYTYGLVRQHDSPQEDAAVPPTSAQAKGGKVKARPLERRNFLTSPASRGSYGSVGLNIGGRVSGVVGEYEYHVISPFEKAPGSRPDSTSMMGPRAFSPAHPSKRGTYGFSGLNIGGSPMGSFGEYSYYSMANDSSFSSLTSRSEGSSPKLRPFLPSQPSKYGAGNYGCLGAFPEHMADPETERIKAEREARARAKAKIKGGVFKPSSITKSIRQPSVLGLKANHSH